MNATDFFLFPLTFLVLGLLAGWMWQLSRQHGRWPGQAPDGELDRLSDRLAQAVRRLDVLERRNEELLRELGNASGTGESEHEPEPQREPEPEVSESQWRSAMDRLGPAWRARPPQRDAPLDGLFSSAEPPGDTAGDRETDRGSLVRDVRAAGTSPASATGPDDA